MANENRQALNKNKKRKIIERERYEDITNRQCDSISFSKVNNIKRITSNLLTGYGRQMSVVVITSDGLERSNRAINKVQIMR